MIFLLEEVTKSNELITYVANLGDNYKSALKTTGGKFLGFIGKDKTNSGVDLDILSELILKYNDLKVSLDVLELIRKDSSQQRYEKQFFDVALQLSYPKLCKDRAAREIISSAAEQYGYQVERRLEFKHPFLNMYLTLIEKLPVSDSNRVVIFGFLYTNFKKRLDKDHVTAILTQFGEDFNCASTRDTTYKLNAYVWILSDSNQQAYGIIGDNATDKLTWETPVKLDDTEFPVSGGARFGSLDANEMQNWLDQFKENESRSVSFKYFVDQNKVNEKNKFLDKYRDAFTRADATTASKVISFIEDKATSWNTFVNSAPDIPLDITVEKLLKRLSKYIDSLNKKKEDATSTSSTDSEETTPAAAPSEDTSTPKTGIAVLKTVLKKETLKTSDVARYARRVAKKAGIEAMFTSKALNTKEKIEKLSQRLQKPLRVKRGATDSDALNAVIIDWIKRSK